MKRIKFNEKIKIKDGVNFIYLIKRFISHITILSIIIIIIVLNTNNTVSDNVNNKANEIIAEIYNVTLLPIDFVASMIYGFKEYIQLQKINEDLKVENSELKHKLEHLKVEISYNDSLKKLLNVALESNNEIITARVISKNFNNFEASFLINAGIEHGVAKNQMVLNDLGLIGRVIKVYSKSARVMAITDIRSKVPVMFKISNQQAIVTGSSLNQLSVKYMPQIDNIIDDEEVVASGVGGIFHLNTKIGQSKKIGNKITIKPFVDFNKLDYVIVVKD